MSINYIRKADIMSTGLTIKNSETGKQYYTEVGKTGIGLGSFQWSYRDLSELLEDRSNLDALERTNDTKLSVGTKVVIEIYAISKNNIVTLRMNYTITQSDYDNSMVDIFLKKKSFAQEG